MRKNKKGTIKLHMFLIGLVLSSLIASIFLIATSNLAVNYGTLTAEDMIDLNDTQTGLNQIEVLAEDSVEWEQETTGIEQPSGEFDIVGGFISQAFKTLQKVGQSFTVFNTMMNTAFSKIGLGEIGGMMKVAFGAIIMILIVVGVFLSALMKSERI